MTLEAPLAGPPSAPCRSRPRLGLYTVPVDAGLVLARTPIRPARQAGLQRGDMIMRINGSLHTGLTGGDQDLAPRLLTSLIVSIRAVGSATPFHAMSRAQPWSTVAQLIGTPITTADALMKASTLTGICA
jgi:hypothetical protein